MPCGNEMEVLTCGRDNENEECAELEFGIPEDFPYSLSSLSELIFKSSVCLSISLDIVKTMVYCNHFGKILKPNKQRNQNTIFIPLIFMVRNKFLKNSLTMMIYICIQRTWP